MAAIRGGTEPGNKTEMKIFESKQLKDIDIATCEAQKIDTLDLVERAAEQLSNEIISRFLLSQRFVVIAGPGNNGADALAVSRMLIEQGYRNVEIYLFNIGGNISHDCDEEWKRLLSMEVFVNEVSKTFTPPVLGPQDVVIDGLFGSGLKRTLEGGFMSLVRYINESGPFVVSIDIPSGLMGEWNSGNSRRDMIHADLTLTMQTPRLSFFFEENYEVLGDWKLLDIDLDSAKMKELQTGFMLLEDRSVRPLLRPRHPFTGKRDYGSALLFAGSMGMMGAGVLAATATLRAGAGLATVHSARCGIEIVQSSIPEAMFEPDRNERFITDMTVHHDHQAVGVGPGIGTHEQTIEALEALLKTCKAPMVLDADALNCIAKKPALLTLLPQNTIITPHIGEFDRLFGEQRDNESRLKKAIEMARYYNIVIVLKGHRTATVRPTGKVYFNSTGNPGMATAGAGDVLTGVITGLLAQGYRPEHAATIGVYIHGLAGDMAAEEVGEYGLMAGDIASRVGLAIKKVSSPNSSISIHE